MTYVVVRLSRMAAARSRHWMHRWPSLMLVALACGVAAAPASAGSPAQLARAQRASKRLDAYEASYVRCGVKVRRCNGMAAGSVYGAMYDGMNAVEGYWGGKCNLRRWDAMVPLSMAAAAQWMITARRAEGITATRRRAALAGGIPLAARQLSGGLGPLTP